jgi:LPS export ABC transporter protein LptC
MRPLYLFFLVTVIVLLTACKRSQAEEAYLKDMTKDEPVQEAYNVKFMLTEKAILQARLTAPHVIERDEANGRVSYFDKGLHLEFFTPEGAKESDLVANEGVFRNKFAAAEVFGNVVVTTNDGKKMETEKLFWNRESDSIYTDQFVKIRTKDQIIYGDSLDSDTKFNNFRIYNIRGTIPVESGDGL